MASESEQERRETLADIEADLRDRADCAERHGDRETHNDGVAMLLRSIADRIKSAAKRVVVSKTETTTVGNAAALRKALSDACYAMFNFLKTQSGGYEEMAISLDKAKAALSAPARQCDVGTAEEQFKRYLAFCHCESRGCQHCPANETRVHGTSNCDLAWAQMPYAEEGGAE